MQDEDADERTLLITSRFPFTSRLPELISLAERESWYPVEDYTISITWVIMYSALNLSNIR